MDEIKKAEESSAKTTQINTQNKNPERKAEAPAEGDDMVTRLKIIADNAKKQIEHIKRRDPAYDVSKMEALVQPYIDAKTNAVGAHNARIDALSFHSTDAGCYGLFEKNTTTEFISNGNLEEDIKKHIVQLEDYNKRLDYILKNKMAGVENCKDYIKNRTEAGKKRFLDYKASLEKDDSEIETRSTYRELVGEEAYWNAAKLLYPDIAGAAEVHVMIKNFLSSSGGLDGLLAKAKAKKTERLKNTFMPKAVTANAAMEAEFREAFTKTGWGETIVKINLLTKEWTIVRNNLGVILCRTQQAAIVAKQKAGNCALYTFTIKQEYIGGTFSSASSRYSHDVWELEFLCENAR